MIFAGFSRLMRNILFSKAKNKIHLDNSIDRVVSRNLRAVMRRHEILRLRKCRFYVTDNFISQLVCRHLSIREISYRRINVANYATRRDRLNNPDLIVKNKKRKKKHKQIEERYD